MLLLHVCRGVGLLLISRTITIRIIIIGTVSVVSSSLTALKCTNFNGKIRKRLRENAPDQF